MVKAQTAPTLAELLEDKKESVPKTKRFTARRFDTHRGTSRMFLETQDVENSNGKMEVKITINMKQLEKHHREIESYISPFTPSPDSIFLRIPPLPKHYERIENARDELDKLCQYVHRATPNLAYDEDARQFLEKLRKIDVRLSALYPRAPAPGDPQKKSYRMCPCFEPELEDIEKTLVSYFEISRGVRFILRFARKLQELDDARQARLRAEAAAKE